MGRIRSISICRTVVERLLLLLRRRRRYVWQQWRMHAIYSPAEETGCQSTAATCACAPAHTNTLFFFLTLCARACVCVPEYCVYLSTLDVCAEATGYRVPMTLQPTENTSAARGLRTLHGDLEICYSFRPKDGVHVARLNLKPADNESMGSIFFLRNMNIIPYDVEFGRWNRSSVC